MGKSCFSGLCQSYLRSQLLGYIAASRENRALSEAGNIVNRFLRRFPISLPDTEDPTAEELAAVNDNIAQDEEDIDAIAEEEREVYKKRVKRRVLVCHPSLFFLIML